jgi:hypothetical protein
LRGHKRLLYTASMNIDDLSKSQLLLLTLLVNFVMSIATGIVTVSLLDVAPATVTQTVNRIVEHTVETIVPASQGAAAVTAQPTEEDLLVSAISGNLARTVNVYAESTTTPSLAQGIYLSKSRAVVVLSDSDLPKNAIVGFQNGSSAEVSISRSDEKLTVYGFGDTTALPSAPATTLLAPTDLKQGQAVIAITQDGSAVTGIVSKIIGEIISTTLPVTPKGAAAVSLSGGLIGIGTGDGSFISAAQISELLSASATPAQ